MRTFKVYYSSGERYQSINRQFIEADWFRITWFRKHGVFYQGLRKVAWFQRIHSVNEGTPE